ncbi:MAG TPA: cell division protein SepF [Candidatus Norongarragalinales archaeon]|nr:cell division protein SepF [Candidatus Norongarragalinales archaeon]
MGVFDGLTKALGIKRDMNLDEFMTAAEAEEVDVLHKEADFYVKPIALQRETDVSIVEEELKGRNLVLLNIAPIARNPQKLKDVVSRLKGFAVEINGDIARIDEDKILLTPHNVKIVKRKH